MSRSFKPGYPSLRTHWKTVQKFIPPRRPFVQYEASDEAYCVWAGIAEYEERPVDLWDVRSLHDGSLVGYTRREPGKWLAESAYPCLQIRVMEPRNGFTFETTARCPTSEPIKTVQVHVEKFQWSHYGKTDTFLCWMVRTEDAEALARSNWLECIGPDNQDEFAYSLAKAAYHVHERFLPYR